MTVALPLEAINFWVVGYPAAEHPIFRLAQNAAVALQWYLLHLPALLASDSSIYLREHPRLDFTVFFIAGYIDILILLLVFIGLARMVTRVVRKAYSPLDRAA